MVEDTPPGVRPDVRLSGWKDIAFHLGRGVRTAQRWEKDHGLPVRRLGLGKGETVFAFSREIDDWLVTSEADSARAISDNLGADTSEDFEPPNGVEAEKTQPGPGSAAATAATARSKVLLGLALAAALVGCVALGSIGYHYLSRLWLDRQATPGPAARSAAGQTAEPASVHIDFDTLVAIDSKGAEIWRRPLGFRANLDLYRAGALEAPHRIGLADIDGDTHREVLVVASPLESTQDTHPRLWVFNSDGTPRWSYQLDAKNVVQFGSEQFTGPWAADMWFVTVAPENAARRALWVSSHHAAMFPAALQRLNPETGAPLSSYWSDGYIVTVNLVPVDGRWRLLIGSCNNETKGAALAMLDASRPTGSAPSQLPAYRCVNCPSGEPLAFVVFPKPRRFRAIDESSPLFRIEKLARGFNIGVRHAAESDTLVADVYYALDENFRPVSVDVADGFKLTYQALVRRSAIAEFVPARSTDLMGEFMPLFRWNGHGYTPVDRTASSSASAR